MNSMDKTIISFLVIVILATIQFLIDINEYPCKVGLDDNLYYGLSLLYIHHVLDIYIYFGGYFTNPLYHLITIVILLIHWITNDDKCFLTQWVNAVCYPEYSLIPNNYKRFNDFSNMLGIQDKYPNIHYYYVIFMICYDLVSLL
tara:strand:- start:301 stop:732 length:432 start_codon:yes stop_codon:yes gene_type:complete